MRTPLRTLLKRREKRITRGRWRVFAEVRRHGWSRSRAWRYVDAIERFWRRHKLTSQ